MAEAFANGHPYIVVDEVNPSEKVAAEKLLGIARCGGFLPVTFTASQGWRLSPSRRSSTGSSYEKAPFSRKSCGESAGCLLPLLLSFRRGSLRNSFEAAINASFGIMIPVKL